MADVVHAVHCFAVCTTATLSNLMPDTLSKHFAMQLKTISVLHERRTCPIALGLCRKASDLMHFHGALQCNAVQNNFCAAWQMLYIALELYRGYLRLIETFLFQS